MTKIIKLKNEEYMKRLNQTILLLENTLAQLESDAINLALLGKWQNWSDQQPEGAMFNFSEAIHETGDANVDIIIELRNNVYITVNKLRK